MLVCAKLTLHSNQKNHAFLIVILRLIATFINQCIKYNDITTIIFFSITNGSRRIFFWVTNGSTRLFLFCVILVDINKAISYLVKILLI